LLHDSLGGNTLASASCSQNLGLSLRLLCERFRRLGNRCLARKIFGFVVEVGVGCLALFSIELFGCFFWDVICKGVKGYVIVGWDAWVWIICGV
jgi:hypothetical protein